MTAYEWPHDDTESLLSFYGRPWQDLSLLTHVVPQFRLTYGGTTVHAVLIHKNCADALNEAFQTIWDTFGHDQDALDATGFTNYSGSYNYRNVRGASRLSCHSFGAALDFDAAHNAMGTPGSMDPRIVAAFKAVGAFWGGDFKHRSDPMHFQFAHE